jgi:hypothetical protein
MAEHTESNERYVETVAILTVLLQIRDHLDNKVTDSDIAKAENLLTTVRQNL